jgi:hypothetical protein
MKLTKEERRQVGDYFEAQKRQLYLFLRWFSTIAYLVLVPWFYYLLRTAPEWPQLRFYFVGGAIAAALFVVGCWFPYYASAWEWPRVTARNEVTPILDTEGNQRGKTIRLSWGINADPDQLQDGVRLGFSKNISSVPEEYRPDKIALILAESLMAEGKELDAVARLINPDYAGWDPTLQQVYRDYLEGELAKKRARDARAS